MKKIILLENHPWIDHAKRVVIENTNAGSERYFQFPIIEAMVTLPDHPNITLPVNILFDTGTDVTIVNPTIINNLEAEIGGLLPVYSSVNHIRDGVVKPAPMFKLDLVFERGQRIGALEGFAIMGSWHFDIADIWLGQDILGRCELSINAPARRLSLYQILE